MIFKKPKLIIFDFDNTLYDYDYANKVAIKELLNKCSQMFSLNKNLILLNFNKARAQIKKQLGNTASSHSRLLYIYRMLEIFNLKSQINSALELERIYWRSFISNMKLFPNVINFLDQLRILDIKCALLTDLTSDIQFRKISALGLEKYFDHVVTSEESGADKPSNQSFELLLKKTKILPKNEIWMIGDNIINDIYGAKKNLKAKTFYKIKNFFEDKTYKGVKPDKLFSNFSEMIKLIKNY